MHRFQAPDPRRAAVQAVLFVAAIVLAQHALAIGARDLWYADEVRQAAVWRHFVETGDVMALRLDGQPYPDKPPVYFWLAGAFAWLAGSTRPSILFAFLAATVAFHHLSAYFAARVVGLDHGRALLAVAILATASYPLALSFYARMDFLFAGLIAISLAAFFRALQPTASPAAMIGGFVLAAVAVLTKGPFGALLPFAALVGFALWSRLARLLSLDTLIGVLVFLAIIGSWAAALIHAEGPDYLLGLLRSQILERAFGDRSAGGVVGYARYLMALPLVGLPWTLAFAVRPDPSRADEGPGEEARRFLWITVGAGLVVLSLSAEKHEFYLLPLLTPLAALAALRLAAGRPADLARLWVAIGVLGVIVSFALLAAANMQGAEGAFPASGLAAAGGVQVVTGVLLVSVRRRGIAVPVAVLLAGQTAWANVLATTTARALDERMSPRTVAAVLAGFERLGYAPAAMGTTRGVYAFHLGRAYAEPRSIAELQTFLATHPKAIIAVTERVRQALPPTAAPLHVEAVLRLATYRIEILRQEP